MKKEVRTELMARIYFYTKLGWSNYIAWWLGAIAYITIIYELLLTRLIPASLQVFVIIFLGMMVISFMLGYFMRKKGIYGIESKINTESNPYIQIPIGNKEILNYNSTIAALDREIRNYKVEIAICKKLGIHSQIPPILENIKTAKTYKDKFSNLLNKAIK